MEKAPPPNPRQAEQFAQEERKLILEAGPGRCRRMTAVQVTCFELIVNIFCPCCFQLFSFVKYSAETIFFLRYIINQSTHSEAALN